MSRRQAINEVRSLAVRLDAVFGSWWSDTWRPRRPEEQSRRLYGGQRRTVILASKLAESLYGEAFPGHVDVATVLAAFENRARAARCALCQQPLTQHCDYEASVAERGLLFCRTCWDSRVPEVTAMVASEGMMIMCDNCGEDVTMRVREHACGDESKRARR